MEQQPGIEQWYTISQVAKALGVGYTRVHYWCLSGKIGAVDLNHGEPQWRPCYRIPHSALLDLLESKKITRPVAMPRPRPRKKRRFS